MLGRRDREKYICESLTGSNVSYLQSIQIFFPFSSAEHLGVSALPAPRGGLTGQGIDWAVHVLCCAALSTSCILWLCGSTPLHTGACISSGTPPLATSDLCCERLVFHLHMNSGVRRNLVWSLPLVAGSPFPRAFLFCAWRSNCYLM